MSSSNANASTALAYSTTCAIIPTEFDLIHDESGSFFRHADRCPVPVLATLHLPRSFYREGWLRCSSHNVVFNCVSQAQALTFDDLPEPDWRGAERNRDRAIRRARPQARLPALDGPHLRRESSALGNRRREAGRGATDSRRDRSIPSAITSNISSVRFGHILGTGVQFVDSPLFEQKVALLRNARALLLTSTAEETSSLVAMEAMACGTPVIAMRRGAFPEIVAHGETGFIVDDVHQMASAIAETSTISSAACRQRVERIFSAQRMANEYATLYRRVIAARSGARSAA